MYDSHQLVISTEKHPTKLFWNSSQQVLYTIHPNKSPYSNKRLPPPPATFPKIMLRGAVAFRNELALWNEVFSYRKEFAPRGANFFSSWVDPYWERRPMLPLYVYPYLFLIIWHLIHLYHRYSESEWFTTAYLFLYSLYHSFLFLLQTLWLFIFIQFYNNNILFEFIY